MAVPEFQTIMLPLLRFAGDGNPKVFSDSVDALAAEFGLTDEEKAELLPSGRYPRFRQRVGWAKTYLYNAKLLSYGQRGGFQITDRGKDLLAERPDNINIRFLMRYPEFVEFRTRAKPSPDEGGDGGTADDDKTPREVLETSFLELRRTLAEDLLERVKSNSPDFFQRLVVNLLVSMGYGGSLADAGSVVGGSADRGIDGIVKQDVLGLEAVYVQAKRYGEVVIGSEIVRNFGGSLLQHKASKGVLMTTSRFSAEAKLAAEQMDKRIVLIDGQRLAELMIDFGVGVSEDQAYVVKRIDTDYFDEQ
jgi:restriction system protein